MLLGFPKSQGTGWFTTSRGTYREMGCHHLKRWREHEYVRTAQNKVESWTAVTVLLKMRFLFCENHIVSDLTFKGTLSLIKWLIRVTMGLKKFTEHRIGIRHLGTNDPRFAFIFHPEISFSRKIRQTWLLKGILCIWTMLWLYPTLAIVATL